MQPIVGLIVDNGVFPVLVASGRLWNLVEKFWLKLIELKRVPAVLLPIGLDRLTNDVAAAFALCDTSIRPFVATCEA